MNATTRFVLLLPGVIFSLGASYRTTNFDVEAPTQEIAQDIGKSAERLRKELTVAWLKKESAAWSQRCALQVKIFLGEGSGHTTVAFDDGRVLNPRIVVEGSLEHIRTRMLPHELTHLIFAFHFGKAAPRWADEGGALLGEDAGIWEKHDQNLHRAMQRDRLLALRRLFSQTDYPADVGAFYAQAGSVSRFLVQSSSRPMFLSFIAHGNYYGWDQAAQSHYGYRSVEDLERAWMQHERQAQAAKPAQQVATMK